MAFVMVMYKMNIHKITATTKNVIWEYLNICVCTNTHTHRHTVYHKWKRIVILGKHR